MTIKKKRAVEILMGFRSVENFARRDDRSLPFRKGITANRMRLIAVGNEYDTLMKGKYEGWKANQANHWSELMYNTDAGYKDVADKLMQKNFTESAEYVALMEADMEYIPYEITLDEVLDGTDNLPMDILLMYPEVFVETRTA